jgi:hypothetical protein
MNVTEDEYRGRLVLQTFGWLINLGYILEVGYLESDLHIVWQTFKFSNGNLKRSLDISYFEDVDPLHEHYLALSIIRLPYQGVSDYFSLSIYLNSASNHSFSGQFDPTRFESCLNDLQSDLKDASLDDVLTGKTWLEGYYPSW